MVRYPNRQGGDGVMVDQQIVITPVEFTIQKRDGIKENWRISYDGDYYDIINIKQPYGRFGHMVLVAQKLSSDNG